MELVRNIKCVDSVVPQNEYSPLKNVLMINPDILMESESHLNFNYIKELKKRFKGSIIFTPYYKGISSTQIKEDVKREWKPERGV